MKRINLGIDNITKGNYNNKMTAIGSDEFGEISSKFNIAFNAVDDKIQLLKHYIKSYGRFVPFKFLILLGNKKIIDVNAGNKIEKNVTISITGIRNYFKLCDKLFSEEIFELLNRYLLLSVPIVTKNNGIVVKYQTDKIISVFPNSPDDAVDCAIEIQRNILKFRNSFSNNIGKEIFLETAINNGSLLLGTIGEGNRIESVILSESLNNCFSIKESMHNYNVDIVTTDSVVQNLANPLSYKFRILNITKMKENTNNITIFEVFNHEKEKYIDLKIKTKEDFELGVFSYYERKYEDAINYFNKTLEQNPNDLAANYLSDKSLNILSMI